MITLNYFEGKDLKNDELHLVKLENQKELRKFITSLSNKDDNKTVYLFTSDFHEEDEHEKEILIESSVLTLGCLINAYNYEDCVCHLQEYNSFQEAYAVALDMREANKLCYK